MEKKFLKLNILFFSQYFWPENFRINELVEEFNNKENIVLTSYPSYPNYKIFKDFKKNKDDIYTKSKIIRVPVFPRSSNNISIILNFITFLITSFFYSIFPLLKKKTDIIFIFCPSPTLSAIPILLINKIFKKKVVLWVLDLWPDTIIDLKIIKNKFLIKILKKLISFVYDSSDLILAQSESIKKEINQTTKTKCIFFPSWPEEKISKDNLDDFDEIEPKKNINTLRIMFTGNIGEAQSFDTMIEAALILKKTLKVEWLVVGDGRWKNKLKEKILKYNLKDEIKLLNSIPVTKIKSYTNYTDVLYLSLKDNDTFNKTIPGKLQTYMSIGKPIIASISGEACDIIKRANCGLVSKAEDYKELAKNIKIFVGYPGDYRRELGKNGYIYSEKFFNKKEILQKLKNELIEILK